MAFLVLLVLVLGLAAAALVRELSADGYGARPAPLSHAGWGGASLPSAPFASQLDR